MTDRSSAFVPAAGHDWLLPLYDPLLELIGADSPGGISSSRPILEPHETVHRLTLFGRVTYLSASAPAEDSD